MIKPKRILTQTRHHHDGIVTKQILSAFENGAVDDIEMIILEFTGRVACGSNCKLSWRIYWKRIVPWLESDKRRSLDRSFVDQLAANPNSQIKIRCRKRRMAVHQERGLARAERATR